jgi:uncharacterized integral membrane protein
VIRAVIYLLIVVLMLLFASQNLAPVELHIFIGAPLGVPLVLLLAIAFVAGYALALLSFIITAQRKLRARWQQRPKVDVRRADTDGP